VLAAAVAEAVVDAAALVEAEECAVAGECAQAVELSAPQEVADIVEADSLAAVAARLRCRDLLGFHRHLPDPVAVVLQAGRRICVLLMAICQRQVFDPAQGSVVGPVAARPLPIGRAASDQARAFVHRPVFVPEAAPGPPMAYDHRRLTCRIL
jgi:hypothetical protein